MKRRMIYIIAYKEEGPFTEKKGERGEYRYIQMCVRVRVFICNALYGGGGGDDFGAKRGGRAWYIVFTRHGMTTWKGVVAWQLLHLCQWHTCDSCNIQPCQLHVAWQGIEG